jgi:hypothetical protein
VTEITEAEIVRRRRRQYERDELETTARQLRRQADKSSAKRRARKLKHAKPKETPELKAARATRAKAAALRVFKKWLDSDEVTRYARDSRDLRYYTLSALVLSNLRDIFPDGWDGKR